MLARPRTANSGIIGIAAAERASSSGWSNMPRLANDHTVQARSYGWNSEPLPNILRADEAIASKNDPELPTSIVAKAHAVLARFCAWNSPILWTDEADIASRRGKSTYYSDANAQAIFERSRGSNSSSLAIEEAAMASKSGVLQTALAAKDHAILVSAWGL